MYSSTTLDGPARSGCWKMLDFSEQGADSLFPLMYRSYLGQAAHAVLQYCAERKASTEQEIRKVAKQVGESLIKHGRTFRGRQEPPLPADDTWQGVDLAVDYLMTHELPLDAVSLISEDEWVHPSMPYRALIDLVHVDEEGDEDYSVRVVTVTDYKSGWQAGEDELNTLQRWGQAICVWRNIQCLGDHLYEDISIIRQRIVNLRTQQEFTRDIHLDDPDEVAELEKWEKRIADLCETADGTVNPGTMERPANPGAGCLSCAYRHICEDAKQSGFADYLHLGDLAINLAQIEGQRSLLINAIKESGFEHTIFIDGGYVGYRNKVTRLPKLGAEQGIVEDWFRACMAGEVPEELRPVLTSLLIGLRLTKSNLDALAKAMYPERNKGIAQVREEYVEGLTVEKRYGQFGVWADEK